MSRSVDLFIDSTKPIDELAAEVSRAASVTLAPGELPGTWALDAQDVHAELHTHPYVDDGDLVLSRYRYALSARVAHDRRLADASETMLLRLVSESLRRSGIPSLLVLDLQYRDRGAPASADGAAGDGTAPEEPLPPDGDAPAGDQPAADDPAPGGR